MKNYMYILPILLPIIPVFIYLHNAMYCKNLFSNEINFLINIYPLLVILIIAFKQGVSRNNKQFRGEGSYIRPLAYIAMGAFTAISLIISLQTNILSGYNENFPKSNKYKWFYANEILKFPLTQYALTNKQGTINIKDGDLNNADLHLYIVDKTKSIPNKYDSYSQELSDTIDNRLIMLNGNPNFLKLNLIDKVLFYDLLNINRNGNSKYAVCIYFGEKGNINQLININYKFIYNKGHDVEDVLNTYTKNVSEYGYNALHANTNLKGMLVEINKKIDILRGADTSIKTIYLHILSDFYDDYKKNMRYYNNELNKLSSKVYKISLIEFQTKYPSLKSDSSRNFFYKTCNNISSDRIRHSDISTDNSQNDLDDIMRNLEEDYKNGPNISQVNFYSPYEKGLSQNVIESVLNFDSIKKKYKHNSINVRFFCQNIKNDEHIKISCEELNDEDETNTTYEVLSSDVVEHNYPVKTNDILCSISGDCSLIDKKMYIDVSVKKSNTSNRYMINIMPILPQNISLYLIFFYSILLLSVSLMIFLSSYIHLRDDHINPAKALSFFEKYILLRFTYRMRYPFIIGILIAFNLWYCINIHIYLGLGLLMAHFAIVCILLMSIWEPFKNSRNEKIVSGVQLIKRN